MLSINYSFNPLRMVISKKEPIEFTVELTNKFDKDVMASLEIIMPKEISFGKGTFKKNILERIDCLKAGEKKVFHYALSAHPLYIEPGEITIGVNANIHHKGYSYIERAFRKDVSLIVSE